MAARRFGGQASRAYDAIRSMILRVEIAPGTRIGVREMAGKLGMSAAPVRDALIQLSNERLVSGGHGVDWAVPLVTREMIDSATVVRVALEAESARRATESATPDDIRKLRELAEEIDGHSGPGEQRTALYVELESRFHLAMAQLSGSRELCEEIERWKVVLNWKRLYLRDSHSLWRGESHVKLANAIASGDADFAERQMRYHILHPWQKEKCSVEEAPAAQEPAREKPSTAHLS